MFDGNKLKLFRNEALLNPLNQHYGGVEFARPRILVQVVSLVIFVSILFSLLLIFGKVGRHVTLSGSIIPPGGVRQVTTLHSGIVDHLAVEEGDTVLNGELILGLSMNKVSSNGESISSRIAFSLNNQISQLRQLINLLEARSQQETEQLRSEIRFIDTEISLLNGSAESALVMLEKESKQSEALQGLYLQGAISEIESAKSISAYHQVRQNAYVTELNLVSRQKLKNERLYTLAQLPRMLAERKLEYQQQINQLEQRLQQHKAQNETGLLSPWSGRLSRLFVKSGDTVTSGETVATISLNAHPDHLTAKLWVPSDAVADFQIGQDLMLAIDSFPVEQYGRVYGVVKNISTMTVPRQFQRNSVLTEPGYFEVYVEIPKHERNKQSEIDLDEVMSGVRVVAELGVGDITLLNKIASPLISIYKEMF